MVEKLYDWEARLAEFIKERQHTKFEYGINDCCIFTGETFYINTGIDINKNFRGKYSDLKSMLKFLNGKTYVTMIENICAEYGIKELDDVRYAKRGMPVLITINDIKNEDISVMGIINLNGKEVVVVTEQGLKFYPTKLIKRAWEY